VVKLNHQALAEKLVAHLTTEGFHVAVPELVRPHGSLASKLKTEYQSTAGHLQVCEFDLPNLADRGVPIDKPVWLPSPR
jgi:hypothetical protein